MGQWFPIASWISLNQSECEFPAHLTPIPHLISHHTWVFAPLQSRKLAVPESPHYFPSLPLQERVDSLNVHLTKFSKCVVYECVCVCMCDSMLWFQWYNMEKVGWWNFVFQSVRHVQIFVTPWTEARLPYPPLSPTFAQIHVHWVSYAIQPSHSLSFPSPFALNLPQHQGLFQWVSSLHEAAKILELQLQHQSFQWIFRVDFL